MLRREAFRESGRVKKNTLANLSKWSEVVVEGLRVLLGGRTCPLAKRGHSKDGKKDKLQIVFGLLCNAAGCPVVAEVFPGNTADSATLGAQIENCVHALAWSGSSGWATGG